MLIVLRDRGMRLGLRWFWLFLSGCLLWNVGIASLAWAETTNKLTASFSLNAPVIDQTHTLSASERAALDAKLRAIHQAGRAQIAIVLVPSTGQETSFDAALRLAEQWKLGSAQQDNGLLIFVAVQDRRVQILTGYGLEAVLPDVITSRIIREEITPAFKEGDYAGGLNAAVERIDQILQLDPEIAKSQAMQAQDQAHAAADDPFASLMGLGIFLLILGQFLGSLLGRFLSASLISGLAFVAGYWLVGLSLVMSLFLAGFLFFLLAIGTGTNNRSVNGRRGRGGIVYGGSSGWNSGGGGSSGGGYSGGGGGFGGGGASGSW